MILVHSAAPSRCQMVATLQGEVFSHLVGTLSGNVSPIHFRESPVDHFVMTTASVVDPWWPDKGLTTHSCQRIHGPTRHLPLAGGSGASTSQLRRGLASDTRPANRISGQETLGLPDLLYRFVLPAEPPGHAQTDRYLLCWLDSHRRMIQCLGQPTWAFVITSR